MLLLHVPRTHFDCTFPDHMEEQVVCKFVATTHKNSWLFGIATCSPMFV